LGHFSKDCTSEVVCKNCKGKGHIAKDCTRPSSGPTSSYTKPPSRPTYQTSVATLRRRKTEQRFANGARINGIEYNQINDQLDADEILDEEEFSGIPEGFDQGVSAVDVEVENESESATSEEDSDETELVNALSRFMNKDKPKPKLRVKGAKRRRSGKTN
jgi:hypothetical protein